MIDSGDEEEAKGRPTQQPITDCTTTSSSERQSQWPRFNYLHVRLFQLSVAAGSMGIPSPPAAVRFTFPLTLGPEEEQRTLPPSVLLLVVDLWAIYVVGTVTV